jgi:hypothetical protein
LNGNEKAGRKGRKEGQEMGKRVLDAGVHLNVGTHCFFELDELFLLCLCSVLLSAVLEELATGVSASTLEVLASGLELATGISASTLEVLATGFSARIVVRLSVLFWQ